MKSHRLQSNPDKAEVLWCATSQRQYQLPTTALLIDGPAVDPVTSVRDLGIYTDADLVMRTHVQRTVSRCFAASPTTSDPPLGAAIHVPVTGGHWCYRYAGRPSGLSSTSRPMSSTVGIECSSRADLSHEIHRLTRLLASIGCASPSGWSIQDRCADVQGSAPRYLGPLAPVADQPGRRTLSSASSSSLLVPSTKLSKVGNRVFSVAGPRVCNTLPEETTSAQSLTTFCQRLKTWRFRQSYPYLII